MSFENFMFLRHSRGMREVIGKTRFGNDIWIDFEPDATGYFRLQVVEFEQGAERYDTLCVMESYQMRIYAQAALLPMENATILTDNIDTWLNQRSALYLGPEALTLAHHGSTDRLRYGQVLIHPAYRW